MNFLLDITAEALRANIGSKSAIFLQRRPVDPKFQIEGIAPTNHSSQKDRLNVLAYGIKIFFRFVTIHAFDRRTDSFFIAILRLHSMQRGKKACTL